MKPGMFKPKTARFVLGAVGVALSAGMAALLATDGKLDWRAALFAAGTALAGWVVKQPWQDVLQEFLDSLPAHAAEVVRESLRPKGDDGTAS